MTVRRPGRNALFRCLALTALLAGAPLTAAQAQNSFPLNAYIGNFNNPIVTVIDTATDTVTGDFDAQNAAQGMAVTPDGGTAYIVNTGSDSVSVYDAASGFVTVDIPVGHSPVGAALSPNGALLYVANSADGTISVIDTSTASVTGTITGLPGSYAVTITPDGSQAYVATDTPGMVIVDLVNPSIVASFNFFGDSLLPVISPDGRTAYIATVDNVEVIDVASATHVASISDFGQIPSLAVRPDGAEIWAVNSSSDAIRIIDPASDQIVGSINVGNGPTSISFSADGSKAFVVVTGDDVVDVIDTTSKQIIDQISVPDNSLSIGGFIASAPPASPLAAAILPGGRSVEAGSTATVFATLINGGAETLNGCGIQLPTSSANYAFDYQTTDPATNALIGSPNTPVTIAAGDYQTYLLSFNSSTAQTLPNLPLVFGCEDVTPAAVIAGVDTVDLLFSAVPVPDIIALAATTSGNGVVTVPFSQNGAAAFAVASVNAGSAGTLTVVTDTGDASLPVDVSVCQTNPSNGQCLAPPTSTLPVVIGANETPTFSFFVTASGDIPFAPGTSRIFVRFLDAANVSHGSTSVAVDTN